MLHDEIASGVYQALKDVKVNAFKYFSNKDETRAVIYVVNNTQEEVFQKAMVRITIFSPLINGLPATKKIMEMKEEIDIAMQRPIVLSRGQILGLTPYNVTGIHVDPTSPKEAFLILNYNTILYKN
jgi:hypothetical protein